MKALAIVLLIAPFWTSNGLAQDKKITDLLNNSETRSEIFNTILNDHQLMMDFMGAMKNNDHAMMMMRSDPEMMGSSSMGGMQSSSEHQMMGNSSMGGMHSSDDHQMMGMNNNDSEMMNQMMSMMKEHPEMLPQMMGNMMNMCEQDSTQCQQMTEVMSEHPHMMMMGMQKMKEEGTDTQHSNMKMNN